MYAESLLEQIQELLKSNESLWTTAEIAEYLALSKSTVDNRIIVRKGFPKPLYFSAQRVQRWEPASVRKWAKQQRAA
jgi:predicted DNA-binding transcriptional regulator AlpA